MSSLFNRSTDQLINHSASQLGSIVQSIE